MIANKKHDAWLRPVIIRELKRGGEEHERKYRAIGFSKRKPFYPTWWFNHETLLPTRIVRAELKRMERDGLVVADRRLSNNTLWALTDKGEEL